jgi:Holliday junction resolvase RusA-like endonuclease
LIKLTITGDTPSKKNGKEIIWNKKTGKPFLKSSDTHDNWHAQAMPQLLGKPLINGQIKRVELVFYPKTLRRADCTNRAESVMDLLVDAGIIKDDNWFIVPEVYLKYGGYDRDNPRCEVVIIIE